MSNPDQFIVLPSASIPSYKGSTDPELRNLEGIHEELPWIKNEKDPYKLTYNLLGIKNETDLLKALKSLDSNTLKALSKLPFPVPLLTHCTNNLYPDAVAFLCEKGFNPNTVDYSGFTPISLAVARYADDLKSAHQKYLEKNLKRAKEIAEILLFHGASPDDRSRDGDSTLTLVLKLYQSHKNAAPIASLLLKAQFLSKQNANAPVQIKSISEKLGIELKEEFFALLAESGFKFFASKKDAEHFLASQASHDEIEQAPGSKPASTATAPVSAQAPVSNLALTATAPVSAQAPVSKTAFTAKSTAINQALTSSVIYQVLTSSVDDQSLLALVIDQSLKAQCKLSTFDFTAFAMINFIEKEHVVAHTAYLLGIQSPSYSDVLNKALEIFGQSPMTKENANIANYCGEFIEYGFYFAFSYYMYYKFGQNPLSSALTTTTLMGIIELTPTIKEVIQEQAAGYIDKSFIIDGAVNIVVHTIHSVLSAKLSDTLLRGVLSATLSDKLLRSVLSAKPSDTSSSSSSSAPIAGLINGLLASVIEAFVMTKSKDFIVSDVAAAIAFVTVAGIIATELLPPVPGYAVSTIAAMSIPAVFYSFNAREVAATIAFVTVAGVTATKLLPPVPGFAVGTIAAMSAPAVLYSLNGSDTAAAIAFTIVVAEIVVAGIVAIGSMQAVTGAGLLAAAPVALMILSASNLAFFTMDGSFSCYFATPKGADVHQDIVDGYFSTPEGADGHPEIVDSDLDMTGQIHDFVSGDAM